MEYRIFEENLERLEKKLVRIQNKCAKFDCNFSYEITGEEFVETEERGILRYVIVNVEGTAKLNDWIFIGSVEHTENGNIIKKANTDIEVPERYFTTDTFCEHCNTNRRRSSTYIVMNTVTNEFKQVGKSCLADFTHGLSAEAAAAYISMYDMLIAGESVDVGYHSNRYTETLEILKYANECVRLFGYHKTDAQYSTKSRVNDYKATVEKVWSGKTLEDFQKEMEDVGFNAQSEENEKFAKEAIEWIKSVDDAGNNYLHNLKVICSSDYVAYKNCGFLVSLIPTYLKELDRIAYTEKSKNENNDEAEVSNYIGSIGERIEFDVKEIKCLTSWETDYGMTFVLKIKDFEGNVYTWKTGRSFDSATKIKGTVKSHNEFRGVKQTELTRCKVVE